MISGASHAQPGIARCVLHHVPALMRRHGSGGYGLAVIHFLTEVYGFGGGVIVVCELALDGDNLYVPDAVGEEHAVGNFCSGDSHRYLRVLGKTAFQKGLDDHAKHHHHNHEYPDKRIRHGNIGFCPAQNCLKKRALSAKIHFLWQKVSGKCYFCIYKQNYI